jgi:hypothetical protein
MDQIQIWFKCNLKTWHGIVCKLQGKKLVMKIVVGNMLKKYKYDIKR